MKASHAQHAQTGLVVSAHGRHYVVELTGGKLLQCFPRGRRIAYACGDRVEVELSGDEQGRVLSAHPRSSCLYRSVHHRQKLIAANITQAAIVVAPKPAFDEEVLMRCLIACEHQRIAALIVQNKSDLTQDSADMSRQLELYRDLHYRVIAISATTDVSPLRAALQGHCNVLVGQSGMGKSTIVNALVPAARARTAEISQALDSGKHTTTSARLYHLDEQTSIIDSPGLQTFGLVHLSQAELVACFREFKALLGKCRFTDCQHAVEPGCAVIAAVEQGQIDHRRWDAYRSLSAELASKPPHWA